MLMKKKIKNKKHKYKCEFMVYTAAHTRIETDFK